MSAEFYNNIKPQLAKHLDSRLETVANFASLPDPTIAANFIYEGALIYVSDEDAYYKCKDNTGTLEWNLFTTADLVVGAITITTGTTVLDLSTVTPSIDECYAVNITITGGVDAVIQSISNFPSNGKELTFTTDAGNTVTFTHTNFATASTDQIVAESGTNLVITGRTIGTDSVTFKKQNVAICEVENTTFTNYVAPPVAINVEDSLTSSSTTDALSANQGNILNSLISASQKDITAGVLLEKIVGVSSDTLNVLPRTWDYVDTGSSASVTVLQAIADIVDPAVTGYSGISDNFRLYDGRNYTSGLDFGLWLLPPSLDPAVYGNWINIDSPEQDRRHQLRHGVGTVSAATAGSLAVSGVYYIPWDISTAVIGDDIDLDFNTDGSSTEKVSINFSQLGVYEIKARVVLLNTVPATRHQWILSLIRTNGAQLSTNPSAGQAAVTVDGAFDDGTFSFGQYQTLEVNYTFEVTSLNTNSAFTLGLNAPTGFADFDIYQSLSTLQITKHRNELT